MVANSDFTLAGQLFFDTPLENIDNNSGYTSALLISSYNIRLASEWFSLNPDFNIEKSSS